MSEASHGQLASVVREHAGQLAAALMRVTGDFATAEDLVQDAVLAALQHWPADGIPDQPDAWLFTVARRRALDGFRRADLPHQARSLTCECSLRVAPARSAGT